MSDGRKDRPHRRSGEHLSCPCNVKLSKFGPWATTLWHCWGKILFSGGRSLVFSERGREVQVRWHCWVRAPWCSSTSVVSSAPGSGGLLLQTDFLCGLVSRVSTDGSVTVSSVSGAGRGSFFWFGWSTSCIWISGVDGWMDGYAKFS